MNRNDQKEERKEKRYSSSDIEKLLLYLPISKNIVFAIDDLSFFFLRRFTASRHQWPRYGCQEAEQKDKKKKKSRTNRVYKFKK